MKRLLSLIMAVILVLPLQAFARLQIFLVMLDIIKMEIDILIDKIFDLLKNVIKKYNLQQYSFENLNKIDKNQDNFKNKQQYFKQELNT